MVLLHLDCRSVNMSLIQTKASSEDSSKRGSNELSVPIL